MRVFILFVLLMVHLFAFDTETASKIFDKIFTGIISNKIVYVYTKNPQYKEVIKKAPNLRLVTEPYGSDIILVTNFKDVPSNSTNKILFSTSYAVFRKKPSVIGAFYWKHGRIKIEFLRSRLKEKTIVLQKSLEPFILDEL